MRRLTATLSALLLAACAASDPPQRYFVLEDTAPTRNVAAAAVRADTLLVAPVSTGSFYRTRELAYSRTAGTRAYYRYANWTELPTQAVGQALLARLERSGAWRTVAPTSARVQGSVLLRVHLDELYHDVAAPPGVARIELTAQLVDSSRGTLIERRAFTAAAAAPTYDADGAAVAMRQSLAQVLDELAAWAAAAPAR